LERPGNTIATFNAFNCSSSCNGEDTLTAFVQLDGNLARLEDFCGINTPSSLMSNGHRLTLEFNAPKSSRGSTGFSAQYFFVEGKTITNTYKLIPRLNSELQLLHIFQTLGSGRDVSLETTRVHLSTIAAEVPMELLPVPTTLVLIHETRSVITFSTEKTGNM